VTAPGGPDWAALYERHRRAMYRVAAQVLRGVGMADRAADAVQDAMTSLMTSPPPGAVRSWEALLIVTAKRRALDIVESAAVRHDGGELDAERADRVVEQFSDEIDERVDNDRLGAIAWDKLSLLTAQERAAVWQRVALNRPRQEVATQLEVSGGRVSQLVTQALRKLEQAMNEEGAARGS
jgi:RNA polymerase sigma factor (sigma-70 family)